MPRRPPSDRALRLVAERGVIDLHADTILWMRYVDYDIAARHRNPLPRAPLAGHVDLPRLREGGVRAQLFGIVTLPLLGERGCAAAAIDSIRIFAREAVRLSTELALVRSRAELSSALSLGAVAGVLALEGAHALEGDLENLEGLYEAGLRSLGLAHFTSNRASPCAYGPGSSQEKGLTDFGREVVRYCDERGIIIDLAHTGRGAFFEACRGAVRPRIVSHTGFSGVFPHWRNIDDEQLRAVADTGGVHGVIFAPRYLGQDGAAAVAAHILHGIRVAGEDSLAMGSDFDGFIIPCSDLPGADAFPYVADALLAAGLSEGTVAKILSGNALRVLEAGLP
jgi:membrane dipeptidase